MPWWGCFNNNVLVPVYLYTAIVPSDITEIQNWRKEYKEQKAKKVEEYMYKLDEDIRQG